MAERLTLPPLLAQSVRQGCGFAVTRSSLLPQMAPTSFGPACSHPIKRDTRNQDRYKILDGLRGPRSPCRPCLKVPLIFHPSTFFSWLLAVVSCPWNYRSWLDLYPYRIKKCLIRSNRELLPINEDDASRQYATDDYHCRSKSEWKNEFKTFLEREATEVGFRSDICLP